MSDFQDAVTEPCGDMFNAYDALVTEANLTQVSAKLLKFRQAAGVLAKKLRKIETPEKLRAPVSRYVRVLDRMVAAIRAARGRINRDPAKFEHAFIHLGDVELTLLDAMKDAELPAACVLATEQNALRDQFEGRAIGDCGRVAKNLDNELPEGIPTTPSEGADLYSTLADAYHTLASDIRDDAPRHLGGITKIERLTKLSDRIGDDFDRAVTAVSALDLSGLEAAINDAQDDLAAARKLSIDVDLATCSGAFIS